MGVLVGCGGRSLADPEAGSVSDYTTQVREYLAYCKWSAAWLEARGSHLDPKYHPTESGCAKFVPHGGDATRAKEIRQAFRDVTGDAPAGSAA